MLTLIKGQVELSFKHKRHEKNIECRKWLKKVEDLLNGELQIYQEDVLKVLNERNINIAIKKAEILKVKDWRNEIYRKTELVD
jgi:hypothetical protein